MMARVIYNRLQHGMALGIDATLNYALGRQPSASRRASWHTDSPYNLRGRRPPADADRGAGRASLAAAVNPAEGQWLYYVLADDQGRHTFTRHLRRVPRAKDALPRRTAFC